MGKYTRNAKKVEVLLRKTGIVVVLTKDLAKTPEDVIVTMTEIYKASYIAECTFRIDVGILKEAMQELTKRREEAPLETPFILGVGSIISPKELELAIEMGFDMIVAPANVMGQHSEGIEFIRKTRKEGIFSAPAIMTPTELGYFLEADEELKPNAIKIFPAGIHGPQGFSTLLAPFSRARHKDYIIMPTGGVNNETGPQYQKAILGNGFYPVLGMSSPLDLVKKEKKTGDMDTIKKSLENFRNNFKPEL